jgi:hypothetical protein
VFAPGVKLESISIITNIPNTTNIVIEPTPTPSNSPISVNHMTITNPEVVMGIAPNVGVSSKIITTGNNTSIKNISKVPIIIVAP